MMIKARTKANLSIAMGLTEAEGPAPEGVPRPSSAPTTRAESRRVRRHILSLEASEEQHKQQLEDTPRPQSCLANYSRQH